MLGLWQKEHPPSSLAAPAMPAQLVPNRDQFAAGTGTTTAVARPWTFVWNR